MLLHSQWLDIHSPPTPARNRRDWGGWVQFCFHTIAVWFNCPFRRGISHVAVNKWQESTFNKSCACWVPVFWLNPCLSNTSWVVGLHSREWGGMETFSITLDDGSPHPFIGSLWHHRRPCMYLLKRKTDMDYFWKVYFFKMSLNLFPS